MQTLGLICNYLHRTNLFFLRQPIDGERKPNIDGKPAGAKKKAGQSADHDSFSKHFNKELKVSEGNFKIIVIITNL